MASYRSSFGDLLEPGFLEIYDDAYTELPMMFEKIFNVKNSSKQDEKESGVSGFGLLQQTGEGSPVDYEDPVQLPDVRYTHLKYTKGFKVSEEMQEDDLYNVINDKPAQLGRATRRTAENSAANVFNRAFNTSYTGGDGLPLCSTLHTSAGGLSTQSNASSTGLTLTEENLETARIAARQQVDDKGMRIQTMPDTMVIPVDLEKDARIITQSSMRPGSADNDVNIYKGKYTVYDWEYITQNNTMWFLLDSKQHKLTWFWRVRPEFKQDMAFDTGLALFKTRTRFSNGFSDWRGVWGSLGDGGAYSS